MHTENPWQRAFFRVVTSPMFEVLLVVAVIGIALYAMFDTDAIYRTPHLPLLFGPR
jgi:hypothetical protein